MIISMKLLVSSYSLSMKSSLNLTIDQYMANGLFNSENGSMLNPTPSESELESGFGVYCRALPYDPPLPTARSRVLYK